MNALDPKLFDRIQVDPSIFFQRVQEGDVFAHIA
jgi:hypothetical protein